MKDICFWHNETSVGKPLLVALIQWQSVKFLLIWTFEIGGDKIKKKSWKAAVHILLPRSLIFKFKNYRTSSTATKFGIQAYFLDAFPGIPKSLTWFGKQLSQFLQLKEKKITNIYYKSQEAFKLKHGIATLSIKLNFLSRSLPIET